MNRQRAGGLAGTAALVLALTGCGGGGSPNLAAPAATPLSDQAALGELIFHDVSLSASGRQACASCHVESNAHSPDNALPAQLGGPLMGQQGGRSAPSVRYLAFNTNPGKWYPLKPDGSVDKFNDLPDAYKANVNTTEAPYDRRLGEAPALSDAEIDDVIAFLQTLSDGHAP